MTRVRNVYNLFPFWVEWHLAMGVDHIFMADDCTDESNMLYWLNFYNSSTSRVTIVDFNNKNCDPGAVPYEDRYFRGIFQEIKNKCKWIGNLDMDEYVSYALPSLNMTEALKQEEKKGYVYLRWFNLEGAGVINQTFNSRFLDFPCGRWHHLQKAIARSNIIDNWWWSHGPYYKNRSLLTNGIYDTSHDITLPDQGNCGYAPHGLYVRHFQMMSLEEYLTIRASKQYISDGTRMKYLTIDGKILAWITESTFLGCDECGKHMISLTLNQNEYAKEFINNRYPDYPNATKHIYTGIPFNQSLVLRGINITKL
eukprot:gene11168-14986_t